ncbi:hypothetical protein evm_012707 [Chilo suppressalis]|nr:hypothetical protein evm_012707 [Chilo suppressalis]
MDAGFVKAESTNLPRIDALMIGDFFALNPDFCSAEQRNDEKHLTTHSQSWKEKAMPKKKTPSLTNNPSPNTSQDEATAQETASHDATESTPKQTNTCEVIEGTSSDSVQVLSKSSSSRSIQKSQLTIAVTFQRVASYSDGELRSIVNEILLEVPNAPDILTAMENNIIEKNMLVLQPFEYVTRDISGEKYSTMSKIIPTVNCLREQIKNIKCHGDDEKRIVEPLKERFLKEINNRFAPIENNRNLAVATILDPRFKNIHFSDANACA